MESAIKFGAKRIGHGVGLIHFPELKQKVKENGITLECCLQSNLDTGAISQLSQHPIQNFFDEDIRVTLNTDNMTVSSTNLFKESKLAQSIGFTESEIQKMQDYAFQAAFMTKLQKRQLEIWDMF